MALTCCYIFIFNYSFICTDIKSSVRTVHEKNGSNHFSNFLLLGSADSVPDPAVMNGDDPFKWTTKWDMPSRNGYADNQDIVLQVMLALIVMVNPCLPIMPVSNKQCSHRRPEVRWLGPVWTMIPSSATSTKWWQHGDSYYFWWF